MTATVTTPDLEHTDAGDVTTSEGGDTWDMKQGYRAWHWEPATVDPAETAQVTAYAEVTATGLTADGGTNTLDTTQHSTGSQALAYAAFWCGFDDFTGDSIGHYAFADVGYDAPGGLNTSLTVDTSQVGDIIEVSPLVSVSTFGSIHNDSDFVTSRVTFGTNKTKLVDVYLH